MFTIDLRKGAGLPPKSRPILVGLAIIPFLIPIVGVVATGVLWMQNSMLIRTQQNVIDDNQKKIGGLKEDLVQFRRIEEQSRACSQQLADVDKTLSIRLQTTPVFVELVGNLPEFLTISKLDLQRTDQQVKTASEDKGKEKEKTKPALVVQRKLIMTISGPANDTTDIAVKQYVQKLSLSPKLSQWINAVRITSRNNESVDDRNYSLYEIECAMKDQT